jgi:hypothetical protein
MSVRHSMERTMSIQTVDIGVQEGRQGIRLLPLITGGAAFVLVIAAGIGFWRSAKGDVARVAGVATAPPATTEAVTGRAVTASTITATGTTSTARTDETIYLVSSPEQAAVVQADIDAARAFLEALRQAGHGVSPLEAVVLVAGTPEDTARAAELIGAEHHLRLATGRPDLRVVDLRPAPANGAPQDTATSSDQEMYQRWQQAQAAAGPEPVSHPVPE